MCVFYSYLKSLWQLIIISISFSTGYGLVIVFVFLLVFLPDAYKHYISAWESVPKKERTLSVLQQRLLTEEMRNSEPQIDKQSVAFLANEVCEFCKNKGHKIDKCFKKNGGPTCHYWHRKGHLETFWFKKKRENSKPSSEYQAFVNVEEDFSNSTILWWVDSASSEHICKDKQVFSNLSVLKTPR